MNVSHARMLVIICCPQRSPTSPHPHFWLSQKYFAYPKKFLPNIFLLSINFFCHHKRFLPLLIFVTLKILANSKNFATLQNFGLSPKFLPPPKIIFAAPKMLLLPQPSQCFATLSPPEITDISGMLTVFLFTKSARNPSK